MKTSPLYAAHHLELVRKLGAVFYTISPLSTVLLLFHGAQSILSVTCLPYSGPIMRSRHQVQAARIGHMYARRKVFLRCHSGCWSTLCVLNLSSPRCAATEWICRPSPSHHRLGIAIKTMQDGRWIGEFVS